MKLIINLILLLLIVGLVYVLADSIREPIAFKAEKEKREQAVVAKLMKIRQAQEMYRGVTGEFASDFDTLSHVLRTGQFAIVKVLGDPDDPDNPEAIIYDTLYTSAVDSVNAMRLNLDSLRYVPYTKGMTFTIAADTMTYQKTLVSVVEVGTKRSHFMGKFADPRFAKYDDKYDPTSILKFGNMNAPNTAGNWEN